MIKTKVNELGMWENVITEALDECVSENKTDKKSYIFPQEIDRSIEDIQYFIRVPGSTIGTLILLQDNDILKIKNISLNNVMHIHDYSKAVNSVSEFIGQTIELPAK